MFGPDAGLWEVATQHVGVAILLIVGSIISLLAIGLVIAGTRSGLYIYSVMYYVVAIIGLLGISLPCFIIANIFANSWNYTEARDSAYSQIEQKYDIEVQSLNEVRFDGGKTWRSEEVNKVYGALSATTYSEEGNWTDLEFKYDFTKGQEVILYPVDAETKDKTPVDPKQFLK